MRTITFRHGVTDGRKQIELLEGETVKDAAERSGLMIYGSCFEVRDKNGRVVDDDSAIGHAGEVLNLDVSI